MYWACAWTPKPSMLFPSLSLASRIFLMHSAAFSFAPISGIQPSPNRATLSIRAGAEPPNQMGMDSSGLGLMLALSMRWNSPSKSRESWVQRSLITMTCSSWRLPRFSKVSLSPSYSILFQPTPIPRRKRLFDKTANWATCFATRTVCL